MTELRDQGYTFGEIGQMFGVTRQCVQRALNPAPRSRVVRVRCRECDCDINPAGAVPRDDRDVLCLSCLAQRPDAAFGEHLKAYRLAAGLKVVGLAEKAGVYASVISSYEHGRLGAPTWHLMTRLFQALGVRLAVDSHGPAEDGGVDEHRFDALMPTLQEAELLSVG
jgi:hypothetical protein